MSIETFIEVNNLKPADAIVIKKQPLRLLDHYIIYLGVYQGEHVFIANYTQGTRILSSSELQNFSYDFIPARILKFKGNALQREAAVQRALSRKDQSSYHLLLNNCEHFSSYVQEGVHQSSQVSAFGKSLVVAGLITAASSKKEEAKVAGFFAAALGLLTLAIEND